MTTKTHEPRMKCWPIRSAFTYPHALAANRARRDYMKEYGVDVFIDLVEEVSPPFVSDGVCLWLVYTHRGGSSPSRIQLSYPTWAEGVRAVQSLRAVLRREPIFRARDYEGIEAVEARCEEILEAFARSHGFRHDHALVWHRSPEWLDREVSPGSMRRPGQTFRKLYEERGKPVTCWDEVTA